MENASKALIIAGSVLITVMIIAVAVYIFQRGKELSNVEYTRSETADVQSFNAQFTSYETTWNYGNSIANGSTGDSARYTASNSLNKISDVISAVNLAASINSQNNYGYSYYDTRNGFVETIDAVEVIIDMSVNTPDNLKKYYIIEPNQNVKSNYVYGIDSISSTTLSSEARATRISNFSSGFSTYTETKCNDLLEILNETKLVKYNNSNYTLYKYYFEGTYELNSSSGKIDSIKFTLVYDSGFDNL